MFNELARFCVKQTEYIKKTQTSWLNVAHGGKRGGKNVTNGLAFCIALENHPNKLTYHKTRYGFFFSVFKKWIYQIF